jgi:hypothetical protein
VPRPYCQARKLLKKMKRLPELAIFASASVVSAATNLLLVVFRLTANTQSHAGNRLTTGFRNGHITLFAVHQAFTTWQFTTGTLDGILNGGINLILYCPVTAPATGHVYLL